jgi:hypothetical protein
MHQGGNGNRDVGHGQIAAHERICFKGTRAYDANSAIAEIVNPAVEFPGSAFGVRGQKTLGVHFKQLRKTLVPASLLSWSLSHSMASCLKKRAE